MKINTLFAYSYISIILILLLSSQNLSAQCQGEPDEGTFCPAVVAPVCGCDCVTYGNSCEAEALGITNYTNGECESDCVPDDGDNGDDSGGGGVANLASSSSASISLNSCNLSVSSSFINIGDGAIQGSRLDICFFLSSNRQTFSVDYNIGSISILATLPPSSSRNFNFDVDLSILELPQGVYYLGYYVDCESDINESDEEDNFGLFPNRPIQINASCSKVSCEGRVDGGSVNLSDGSTQITIIVGDGQLDILAGNVGTNTIFKVEEEHPVQLYLGDFDENGAVDPIIFSYYFDR
ncbi:MAG: Kazal-type serine protease inhibitor, partial [Bacteroidota bacterium]